MYKIKPEWVSFKESSLDEGWLLNHRECPMVFVKQTKFEGSTQTNIRRALCYKCKEAASKIVSVGSSPEDSRIIPKSHFVKEEKRKQMRFPKEF